MYHNHHQSSEKHIKPTSDSCQTKFVNTVASGKVLKVTHCYMGTSD